MEGFSQRHAHMSMHVVINSDFTRKGHKEDFSHPYRRAIYTCSVCQQLDSIDWLFTSCPWCFWKFHFPLPKIIFLVSYHSDRIMLCVYKLSKCCTVYVYMTPWFFSVLYSLYCRGCLVNWKLCCNLVGHINRSKNLS